MRGELWVRGPFVMKGMAVAVYLGILYATIRYAHVNNNANLLCGYFCTSYYLN
uniref:Uncharacterized protein n=1 Tax=Arundo donax TaxID=35708 RepID=A0A0A9FQ32_ARUDO